MATHQQNSSDASLLNIQAAFESLEKAIHPSDVTLFRSTTLQDVMKAAKVIESDQSRRRCLRNLRRIQPLFEALGQFSGALETLCQGTPYLCFIWAPIKLLLQIADEYTSAFEQLINAYAQIAQNLPRLDRLSAAFASQQGFQSILADVYVDIIEFHSHAYKFLRRSGWKQAFHALWKNYRARFDGLIQNLARNRDLVDKEAASFDIVESKACRQRLLEDIDKREAERQEWQLRDTIAWLDLKGQDREQDELLDRYLTSREAGTCEWILRHPVLSTWVDDDEQEPLLWINGKPGSGKTMLAAYMVKMSPAAPKSQILHCLCSYGFANLEKNVCSLTFRLFIAQILRVQTELIPYVYENFVKTGTVAAISKTRDLLKDLLQLSEICFIVLDGLDECEESHQRQMLSEILNLCHSSNNQSLVKVLISSRETRPIVRKLKNVPQISLRKEHDYLLQDITRFTKASLSELTDRFGSALVDEIGETIVKKADGMFLWVRLVLDTIVEQESVQDIRRAVASLPSDLFGVYENILRRIRAHPNETERIRAEYILTWLAFAYRPLRHWEICDGLVFSDEYGEMNDETKLGRGVLDICKPLIEDREGHLVGLVHFSVREYLMHQRSGPYLHPFQGHATLTIACLRYLFTCQNLVLNPMPPQIYGDIVRGYHDIFPYVQLHWVRHLLACLELEKSPGAQPQVMSRLIDLLLQFSQCLSQRTSSPDVLGENSPIYQDRDAYENTTTFPRLPTVIQQYLLFRDSTKNEGMPSMTNDDDLENSMSDPTLLSEAFSCFQVAFESLLEGCINLHYDEMDVNQADVDSFRARHSKAPYLCRHTGCARTTFGFETVRERKQHESAHNPLLICAEKNCEERFTTRRSLQNHTRKYHSRIEEMILPPFIKKDESSNAVRNITQEGTAPFIEPWEDLPQMYNLGQKTDTDLGLGSRAQHMEDNVKRKRTPFQQAQHLRQQQQLQQLHQRNQLLLKQARERGQTAAQPTMSRSPSGGEQVAMPQMNETKPTQNRPVFITDADNKWITLRATELAKGTPKEEMRTIVEKMNPQLQKNLAQKGVDPIIYYFRMLATKEFRQRQASEAGQVDAEKG